MVNWEKRIFVDISGVKLAINMFTLVIFKLLRLPVFKFNRDNKFNIFV